MSKERELLNKSIEMIQIAPMMASIGNVPTDFASELILEIKELLAQPEQRLTPLTSKRELLGDGITADMYRANKKATHPDSYWAGVNDAEKAHGIGGGE